MKCDELRKKLNEVRQNKILLYLKLRSEEEAHLKTFLIDVDLKDYSPRELKNMIMNLSRSKDKQSYAYLFPKLSENELKEIKETLNLSDQTSYNLASKYKFCVLDRFSKQSNFEPDPKIVELTQTTKPNIIKTLKAIQIENETEEGRKRIEHPIYGLNGPVRREEVRPYIEKALVSLEKDCGIEVMRDLKKLLSVFSYKDERGDGMVMGFPTQNYKDLFKYLKEYRVIFNINSLAESIDKLIEILNKEGIELQQNWPEYLDRISAGLRHWEVISIDCFDLCVVGKHALQDELEKIPLETVLESWEDLIQDIYNVASFIEDLEIPKKTPKYIHPYTLDRDYVHKAIIKRY